MNLEFLGHPRGFPKDVDELHFQVVGVIKNVDRLKLLYALFSQTLDELLPHGACLRKRPYREAVTKPLLGRQRLAWMNLLGLATAAHQRHENSDDQQHRHRDLRQKQTDEHRRVLWKDETQSRRN